MSVVTEPAAPAAPPPAPVRALARRSLLSRLLILSAIGLVVLSVVRVVTGAGSLTSAGTVGAALGAAVPIGMAGLGGLWSERAGVVNIGLEGMMILGTFGAGWMGWQHGPWVGVLAAVLFGAVGGLIHAVATVTFGVDHIVSGVAINILALGATQFLASQFLEGTPGGGSTQSPQISPIGSVSVPGVSGLLDDVEKKGWFLVSDAAGVVRGLTTSISLITLIAIGLAVLSWWLLWRTPFGLRLRSCGEEPHAAESLGVNVYLYKYVAVVTSGGLAGFGGAFLAIVAASIYREGQTAGRGYIGLAAMIFGTWRPGGLAAGSALFGYTDALQLRSAEGVHALLLVLAALLVGLAAFSARRKRVLATVLSLLIAAVLLVWYLRTDTLPPEVTFMTPYVTTLMVLALASQSLRMPKADGLIYRRGQSR
jgi:simple sugar transport system permease protein